MDLNLCLDAVPGLLSFFDISIAPVLLFYAYIPMFVLSVFFGLFILRRDSNSVLSKYFLGITLSFAVWILLILFMWIGAYLETVHLAWQLLLLPEISLFLFSVLFTYVFLFKRDVSAPYKYFSALMLVVVAIMLPTRFNIDSFDLINCEGVVGVIWPVVYMFELVFLIAIILITIKKLLIKEGSEEKLKTVLFSVGMVLFLGIFWASNYFAELTQTYEINLIGPVGMVLFLGTLSYMMVKFKTFHTKLFTAQILVVVLGFLIGALLFIQKIEYIHIVVWVTLGLVVIIGYELVKSVKREIMLREDLEIANEKLKGLDKLKSEFLSLASHQLRSPLTAIKGYSSMLSEGSFGDLNTGAKEIVNRIFESSNNMALMVEDFLNVSKIEQGGMKYEKINFDFAEMVSEVAKDFSVVAGGKGLVLNYTQDKFDHTVFGDKEKLRQVVINFIDNSIKYTEKGSIDVSVTNKNGKIIFAVKDTGRGISPKEKEALFQKFSRGSGAKVNTGGSGLGLYLAKEIIQAHDGNVGIESAGEGQGSTFFVELDAKI